jgi:hypothetical protein
MKDSNQDAYVLFVDLEKAFDSINREMLWQILAKFGLLVPLVNVIMKMYTDIEVTTSVGKAKATFPSTSGVKQGDTKAFVSMKDIFFDRKIDLKTRKQLYLQIPLNIVLWGCDSSALKQSHLDKLTAFHHKGARWLVKVTRWDCRFQHITMKSILHHLELPTME